MTTEDSAEDYRTQLGYVTHRPNASFKDQIGTIKSWKNKMDEQRILLVLARSQLLDLVYDFGSPHESTRACASPECTPCVLICQIDAYLK